MFGQFFNIDESAFSIAPNPKYLYLSKQHEEALAHLVYGITRKGGFVLLTGDIGTGKTTICRCMFEQLPENTDIAFVINPKYTPLELLASICDELGISHSAFQVNVKDYVKKLCNYLVAAHAKGRNTVLVIDEAQNLSLDALEHIRALTNIETNEQKLLQIILIGQPELRNTLAKPELEQVNQRITARFHIGPLTRNETHQYINHRLCIAGATQTIFSPSNIKQIHSLARGVPRLINILCDRILLGAFTLRRRKISSAIIQQSASEVFDHVEERDGLVYKPIAASVFALLISGAVVFAYQNKNFDLLGISHQNKHSIVPEVEQLELSNSVVPKIEENIVNDQFKVLEVQTEPQNNTIVEVPAKQVTDQGKEKEKEKEKEVLGPVPSTVAKVLVKEDQPSLKLSSHEKAFRDLYRLWGIEYSAFDKNPCEHALDHRLNCYQGNGNIALLAKLNRPVILKSNSNHFEPDYIVMVTMEGDEVIVSEKGEYKLVSIAEVEADWSGEFEMLWRPLHPEVSHIIPGQKSKAVAALEKQLANLAGRKPLGTDPFVYSLSLVEEVKEFQVIQKIPADGIVGPITQIHINSMQHVDVPYLIK